MFCAQCGTSAADNSRFCAVCGARMTDPAAATVVANPPPAEELVQSVRRALAAEYEVEREIGRGGMAVVFRARDKELERTVALKVLPPELAPLATVADRFKREARLAASLDHPNIIPVYRVAQSGGVLYMAMRYVDGQALDALIAAHGGLSLPVVITVLRAAARAIAYAHDHGIVHRDIKGANILIDRDGRVMVSDFGIARAVESSTLTATGVMIGTPHYMSPEQCAGKPVGPQADQYSLGIVAYQLLTGSVPFDGDSLPEILQHHWFTPPPEASQVRADCPAALTATIQRLLAKDPAQRFASTHDLVAALSAIPFSADQRAEGEAELRTLVRARVSPLATRAAADAPASAAVRPGVGADAGDAGDTSGPALIQTAPDVPRPRASDPPRVPTRPLPVTAGARAPSTAANSRGGAPSPANAKRRPSGAGPRPPATRPREQGRRWRVAAIAATLVIAVVGAGFVVAARRAAAGGAVGGGEGEGEGGSGGARAHPLHFSAAQMQQVGTRAYALGDYEVARRFFVRASRLDPSDESVQENLGCALLKLGRVDSARVHFQLAHAEEQHCR